MRLVTYLEHIAQYWSFDRLWLQLLLSIRISDVDATL